jgi:hypothetical protein
MLDTLDKVIRVMIKLLIIFFSVTTQGLFCSPVSGGDPFDWNSGGYSSNSDYGEFCDTPCGGSAQSQFGVSPTESVDVGGES